LKLPEHTAGFEIGLQELMGTSGRVGGYAQLPRFPKVEQDICLKVPAATSYQDLYNVAWNTIAEIQTESMVPSLQPLDIYQREDDADHKQITFRFSVANFEKTMTDVEVSAMLERVAQAAKAAFQAEVV